MVYGTLTGSEPGYFIVHYRKKMVGIWRLIWRAQKQHTVEQTIKMALSNEWSGIHTNPTPTIDKEPKI